MVTPCPFDAPMRGPIARLSGTRQPVGTVVVGLEVWAWNFHQRRPSGSSLLREQGVVEDLFNPCELLVRP